MYTLKQATNILVKAAERADYQHIGFTRSPIEVSIQFHEAYLDDRPELKPFTARTFSFTRNGCYEYKGELCALTEIDEKTFFDKVDYYLNQVCGIHLEMTDADKAECESKNWPDEDETMYSSAEPENLTYNDYFPYPDRWDLVGAVFPTLEPKEDPRDYVD